MKEKEREQVHEPEDPQEELIRRLLKLSGGRPAIPEQVVGRVRESVHSHWKNSLRARTREKVFLILTGSIAASLLLFLLAWYFDDRFFVQPSPIAVVENITGQIVLSNDELLSRGMVVPADSVLESSATGRVLLRTMKGVSLRLDVQSRMRFESDSSFVLEHGAMYLDSGKAHSKFIVHTPVGEVANHGTRFEVRFRDQHLELRVREGSVSLKNDNISREVTAGNRLSIDENGTVQISEFATYGPEWAWLSTISPVFHLEGSTLWEFLSWITHENGWMLSQSQIEQSHGMIVLHGSVENLSPAQMLDAVLPVCGLSYNLEQGVLTVNPSGTK